MKVFFSWCHSVEPWDSKWAPEVAPFPAKFLIAHFTRSQKATSSEGSFFIDFSPFEACLRSYRKAHDWHRMTYSNVYQNGASFVLVWHAKDGLWMVSKNNLIKNRIIGKATDLKDALDRLMQKIRS